jgi:hypothetical protein
VHSTVNEKNSTKNNFHPSQKIQQKITPTPVRQIKKKLPPQSEKFKENNCHPSQKNLKKITATPVRAIPR